jgi:peptidoglycan-associated lipoprotein
MRTLKNFAAGGLGLLCLSACATKGYVRQQVSLAADTSRAAWTAADATVRTEMTAEFSKFRTDLDSVKTSVATLRQDLNALRTDFGARVTAMETGMQFAFPVTFAFDDATVRDQDKAALDRFAQVVNKHYSGSVVTVEGFADPAGSMAYNMRLSEERAESVIAYLTQVGLTGATLRPAGMGETRLVVEGASHDMPGAESNRRVVFVIETSGRPATVAGTENP